MNFLNNGIFFFIDVMKEHELSFLKVNSFFKKDNFLYLNKFFISLFLGKNKDLHLLEKNENFLSLFFFLDKIFFKNQLKTLKIFIKNEEKNPLLKKKKLFQFLCFITIIIFYFLLYLF